MLRILVTCLLLVVSLVGIPAVESDLPQPLSREAVKILDTFDAEVGARMTAALEDVRKSVETARAALEAERARLGPEADPATVRAMVDAFKALEVRSAKIADAERLYKMLKMRPAPVRSIQGEARPKPVELPVLSPTPVKESSATGDQARMIIGARIEDALRWFAIHQSENGMWDVDQFQTNCKEGGSLCEPGKNFGSCADAACTALVLMCFLEAGYDHKHMSKWRNTVKKGIDWLVADQELQGSWGSTCEEALCTMALGRAYMFSGDGALKPSAQKAVDHLLELKVPDPKGQDSHYNGLGWSYRKPDPARMDSVVSGFCTLALRFARMGGVDTGCGLNHSVEWLTGAWKAANPDWEKLEVNGISRFPYTWDVTNGKVQMSGVSVGGGDKTTDQRDLTVVGAMCAAMLCKNGDPMKETLVNYVFRNQMPETYPCNTLYLYYGTLALACTGGERWDRWKERVQPLLIKAQRQDLECFKGSWDYADTRFPGHQTGRLLSTALCCLTLATCLDGVYGIRP